MSREIRFRSWQNKGGLPNASYDTFTIQELMSGRYKYSNYENWEQFTGLKDKQGRPIYEGDILQGRPREGRAEVVFDRGEFVAMARLPQPDCCTNLLAAPETFSEVIGNIHENGDILKQKGGE